MGLIELLFRNPVEFVIVFGVIVLSLSIHEFAHAWAGDKLGDPTPRYQGRLTLNPLAHLDPLGTALLVLVGFGWGKPVEIDLFNLKHPVRDNALIAAAGPISNLLLALFFAITFPFIVSVTGGLQFLLEIQGFLVFYNVMLACFNLVPVYPLDGSKIVLALLPKNIAIEYDQFMSKYGMFVLLALLWRWGGQSPIASLISPFIERITSALWSLSLLLAHLL